MVDLSRLEEDPDRRRGRAWPTSQAGATVADIQRAAEAKGWFYPPDPSSREYCTIGGNIACNAGGMHGGKYGVTRDFVLALKGFLPTGECVEWGTADQEIFRGLQPARPMDRQRGHARHRDRRRPQADPAPGGALDAPRLVPGRGRGLRRGPRALRRAGPAGDLRIPRPVLGPLRRAGDRGPRSSRARPAGRCILLELAGTPSEVRAEPAGGPGLGPAHAAAFRAARNRAEAETLWAVRRKCSGAMFELGDSKLNEDVVVPMRPMRRFARFLERLRRESGPARSRPSATSATATSTSTSCTTGGPRGAPGGGARGRQR